MSNLVTLETKWNGAAVKIQGRKVVNKSAWETGLIVEGQAKVLSPEDTGRLAASITTQSLTQGTIPNGSGAVPTDLISKPRDPQEVLVGTPVFYGPYMEFGTIKTDAQPFLRPALDLAKGKTLNILEFNGKFYLKEYLK